MQIAREMARIGRLLSARLNFDYPDEAERVVAHCVERDPGSTGG
jgi:hypothetical protein